MCHCSEKFSWVISVLWFILSGGGIMALKPPSQGLKTTSQTLGWSLLTRLLWPGFLQGKHGVSPWLLLLIFILDMCRNEWRNGAAACVAGVSRWILAVTNWTQLCWIPFSFLITSDTAFPLLFHKPFSKPLVFSLFLSWKGINSLT